MKTTLPKIKEGLRPLTRDPRDLSLGRVFGYAKLVDVPDTDFIVAEPLKIKDQGSLDFCTGYTVTEVSEDQEGVELCPAFQYAASAKIRGNFEDWGMDLRIAFKSAVDYGSLDIKDRPFNPDMYERNFLANWNNWPEETWEKATKHKKETFFKVDGRYDLFDNIRSNLWKFKEEKRTIGVGAIWRDSWIHAVGGIIPTEYEATGFGHAFKIYGQKVIDGELHLVAQLSNGPIGDNGVYYFKRSVVNKEFGDFGQFMYQDILKDKAIFYQKNNIQVGDNAIVKLWKIITSILKPTYYL